MNKKGITNPAGAITTVACNQGNNVVGTDPLHQFIQSMQRGMEKPIGIRTRNHKSTKRMGGSR